MRWTGRRWHEAVRALLAAVPMVVMVVMVGSSPVQAGGENAAAEQWELSCPRSPATDDPNLLAAESLAKRAGWLLIFGQMHSAEDLLRQAFKLSEGKEIANRRRIADFLPALGISVLSQFGPSSGEDLGEIIDILKRTIGYEDEDLRSGGSGDRICLAYMLDNLSLLYYKAGRFDEAGQAIERVIDEVQTVYGRESIQLSDVLYGLVTYSKAIKPERMEYLLKMCIEIREKIFDIANPLVESAYEQLASYYIKNGDFAKFEATYKKALSIQESAANVDREKVASILQQLAWGYKCHGRDADAKAILNRLALMTDLCDKYKRIPKICVD